MNEMLILGGICVAAIIGFIILDKMMNGVKQHGGIVSVIIIALLATVLFSAGGYYLGTRNAEDVTYQVFLRENQVLKTPRWFRYILNDRWCKLGHSCDGLREFSVADANAVPKELVALTMSPEDIKTMEEQLNSELEATRLGYVEGFKAQGKHVEAGIINSLDLGGPIPTD